MARGGARIGSGPKPAALYAVPPAALEATGDTTALATAPQDLDEAERAVWALYAPMAVLLRTLTDATVPGFRYLCEVTARHNALAARVDDDGWTFTKVTVDGSGQEHREEKRHPLWSTLMAYALRREQALRSYGLIANGRPAGPSTPARQNPWARIAG